VLEKTMREQDKKFNSEKQVDDSVKVISNEVTALNAKQKQFLIKKAQFEKELIDLGASPELEQKRLALNEEMKSIIQEEETIKQKGNRLSTAVGKYSISKSKQGTWGGALANAISEGFSSIAAGTTSLVTDISTEIAPTGFGMSPKDLKDVSIDISKKLGIKGPSTDQTIEQWKKTLNEDQLNNWEDEVDDYIKKDIKSRALPLIRIGNREIFGDADTTKQFSDLKEKGFWGGAILGVAKSLPAMIGGTSVAGWAQRTAQMYAQISDALAVEMENDPSFANISENEKLAITLPIGITSAVLEAYGLRNVMASKGVINSITLSVLGKAGVGASAKTFRELVENEVESKIARGLLTVTAAGVAEFETGAAQEATETGFKVLYDKIKGQDMFDTPDSKIDLIENILVAGAQEAVGGFVLGVPSGISAAYAKKGFLKMDDASFEMFANMANDEKMQSAYIASLKEKITQGIITEKEAKEQLNNYRNSAGLYRQLPEGLSTQQQKEAMNLLKEKRDLENFVEGKDAALVVKQKNRITEINNLLTKLSDTDAIQEQATDESVLRTEQPELELQEMGQGDTQGETITPAQPQEVVGVPDEISQPIELSLNRPLGTPDVISQPIDLSITPETTTTELGIQDEISQPIELSVTPEAPTPANQELEVKPQEIEVVTEKPTDEINFTGKRGQADNISFDNKTISQGEEIELDNVNISQDDSQPDLRSGKYTVRMLSVDANGKAATITLTDGNEVITTTVNDLRKAEQLKEEAPTLQEIEVVAEPAPVVEAPVVETPKTAEEFIVAIDEMAEADENKIGYPIEVSKGVRLSKMNNTYSISFPDNRAKNAVVRKVNLTKEQAIAILNKKIPKTETKAESAPVLETILEEAPVAKPVQTKAEKIISQIDKAIQALFDKNGQDIDTWGSGPDNSNLIALKRAKKALQTDDKTFKTFLNTSMGKRYSDIAAKFEDTVVETPKAKAKENKEIIELEKKVAIALDKTFAAQKAFSEASMNERGMTKAFKKFKELQDKQKELEKQLQEAKAKFEAPVAETPKRKKKTPKVEAAAVEEDVKGKIDELLELDTNDKGTLAKISSELGDWLDDFNRIEKDLGSNILLLPMKYFVQAIKALVDTGISLQEAIKKVAKDNNVSQRDIINGINSVNEIAKIAPQFTALMEKADKLIARQKAKGIADNKIVSNLDAMIRKADIYTDRNTNDAQRKIMEREARAKMGVAPKKSVSIGRVIGALNDITNVSRAEKLKIISRIRDLSKDAAKDLIQEIRELAAGGKITPTQSINIISRFSKVNMLNEVSVSSFVDYMAKVFADADYDNKINVAKGKLKNAKKNIATKIGIADGLAFPLQTLFSINPSLIPIKNLERYMELVDMFSERKAILQLGEISEVIKDVNEILDEIDNELSIADELSFRLNYSDNKVFDDDDNLDYAATVKKMLKEGDITQEEAEIMTKYKSEIIPQVEKSKATDEEIAKEKEELVKQLKKSTVDSNELPTRDERSVAKRIAEYLKTPFINQLSNKELSNLIKAIDNINNGYLPHQVELILEKLDSFTDGKTIANSIEKSNLKRIAQLVNRTYNTIKSKITGKETVFEMIKRTPLFNIDQILGDFKTEELFYGLLGKVAKGDAKNSFDLKTIQEKLKKAQDKVAKSEGYFKSMNPLKAKISSYKIRTYQLQLENDSNPGDKRVNPAAEYIRETIKHIKKLESQYNENDVKILEDILKEFAPDGQIDIDKLYNSFNSAEKAAIKTFQEIKKAETEMAEFTGAVIRGKRINPLNNHTHISVLGDNSKEDLDVGVSFANEYNNSLKPSTKAKNLMERTPGAKPINFDAYSTALKSAKYVLLDYNLTAPIRTARKAIKEAEIELEKNGEMSEEKRRIFNSVRAAFELAVTDLVNNSYVQTSITQDVINSISKQGYRAVLAGLGKSSIELLSNLGYVVYDPGTFYKGVENMGILLSEDGPAIMNNSGSVQTPRVYAAGLSGRMLDLGILDQSVGTKSSKTRGKIVNKAQQVWNLTVKKFIKNPVELTADALISSPDKVIMRPYWLGSYISELEKQLGRKVTKEDLKKIAENNEKYMNENEAAIEAATKVADRKSKLMGATKNGFAGLLRGKVREEDKGYEVFLKNFNAFMTNFMVYEYNAAKTGIMAAIGDGTMTRSEGAAVLAGVITRMTVYNLLIKAATSGVSGLIGSAFGFDDDEEEKEKSIGQMVTQSLSSTFASLLLGRDFGNISKTFVNYGFEEFVTREYLEGLRTGEYDPYKDNILFNSLQRDEKTGEMEIWENIPNFMGSYGPIAKTAALGIKVITANDKKEADAIERQEKERNIRLPLEILGNAGYIPLYKEIRKSVMDDIYKGLRNKSGITKEELKKSDPEMYRIMYGNN
jgi:hypothetical protein